MAHRWGRSVGSLMRVWRQQQQGCKQGLRAAAESSLCAHGVTRPSLRAGDVGWHKPAFDKRFYYTDPQGVVHFKKRGPAVWIQEAGRGGGRWGQRKVLILVGTAGCVCAYVYYNNLEVVPYTHRKHFVLIGPELERQLGEQEFTNLKLQLASKILPPIHPQSVRVRSIASDVIEAAMAGTKTQNWGHMEQQVHIPHPAFGDPYFTPRTRPLLEGHNLEGKMQKTSEDLYGDDKLDDDMWVDKSRQKGLDRGSQPFTAHLNNLKWEVVVVEEDIMNAFCLPGGKIVVFTGLLKLFRSDAEVATVLGHEVGHVVARHVAEKLTLGVWLGFLQLAILSFVYVPGLVASTSDLLLKLPFSRRMESEADHIGLMLMAAAGYDPRVAPAFYEKMGQLEKQPEYLQYLNTHPSGKKRAQALRESATTQEALRIYIEKIAGQVPYGFL